MKKIYTPLFLALLISSCSIGTIKESKTQKNQVRDYDDYFDLHLEWKNLFSPAKSLYFVYIYSISCQHCERIKQDVLSVMDEHKEMFYLTEYATEIKTTNNVSETIGKETNEDVYILGTPTLLEISDHRLSLNIAGEKEILSYLELLPHNICD